MGKRQTVYREKTYLCGEIQDVYIYPAYLRQGKPVKRGRKYRATRPVQDKLNKRHAQEKFTRLLHANFTENDLSLGLDFAQNPDSKETAMGLLQKFLRKLRYWYKKLGIELKYLWQMEVSRKGRFHFHVVLSKGMDRDKLEDLGGHGWANARRLQTKYSGLAPLAGYISKSHREEEEIRLTYRSYNGSKNLIDPEPKINDSHIETRKRAAALAEEDWSLWQELYPGYEVLEIRPFHSDAYGSIYIFARLRRTDHRQAGSGPGGCSGRSGKK